MGIESREQAADGRVLNVAQAVGIGHVVIDESQGLHETCVERREALDGRYVESLFVHTYTELHLVVIFGAFGDDFGQLILQGLECGQKHAPGIGAPWVHVFRPDALQGHCHEMKGPLPGGLLGCHGFGEALRGIDGRPVCREQPRGDKQRAYEPDRRECGLSITLVAAKHGCVLLLPPHCTVGFPTHGFSAFWTKKRFYVGCLIVDVWDGIARTRFQKDYVALILWVSGKKKISNMNVCGVFGE